MEIDFKNAEVLEQGKSYLVKIPKINKDCLDQLRDALGEFAEKSKIRFLVINEDCIFEPVELLGRSANTYTAICPRCGKPWSDPSLEQAETNALQCNHL